LPLQDIVDDEYGITFAKAGDKLIVVNNFGSVSDEEFAFSVRLPIKNSEAFFVTKGEIRKYDQ
jgi:hypothetical protein